LWCAGLVNNFGNGIWATVMPLVGTSLTRDPVQIALLSAASYLPWLLLSLPAGVLVDSSDPARLMWRTQLGQFLVVALVSAALVTGHAGVALLCAAGFLLGVGDSLFSSASQVVLPRLVADERLVSANTRQQVAQTVGRTLLGPVAGGVLQGVSAALAVLVNAMTFVVSAAILARLPPREDTLRRVRGRIGAEVLEGVRWLTRHRLLRALALVLAVNCFCTQFAQSLLVLLVIDTYHLPPSAYGWFIALMAGSGVVLSLVNPWLIRRAGTVRATALSLVLSAAMFVAVGWAPSVPVLSVLLTVNVCATLLWNVSTVVMRQRIVPPAVQGRIASVFAMVGWGFMPVGALAGGFVSRAFGVESVYPIAGVIRAVVVVAAVPVLVAHWRDG
jgi:MFS family permease